MIHIEHHCKNLLFSGDLEDKLFSPNNIEMFVIGDKNSLDEVPVNPGRNKKIQFSEKQNKFPKNFESELARAKALHFFANHELLAIEMMACAILVFPNETPEDIQVKKGIYASLKDEQKHLALYIERMREFGIDFGDLPLSNFFWDKMGQLKSLSEYLAVMSYTFEAANLDFASFYKEKFEQVGDKKSANIMHEILVDEISHVALGSHWFKKWSTDKDIWSYYLKNLPYPLTPARSMGIKFNHHDRLRAGMSEEFLIKLQGYDDGYSITKRKQWKNRPIELI